jgi:hypothetical protein
MNTAAVMNTIIENEYIGWYFHLQWERDFGWNDLDPAFMYLRFAIHYEKCGQCGFYDEIPW